MTPLTLLKYLIGDREAIEQIVRTRSALWVGLLLVLSAGLAREYDAEYLPDEPWHLLIPLAASLGSAAVLYFVFLFPFAAVRQRSTYPAMPTMPGFGAFLKLYWMTAPLAWLYALPVERIFNPWISARINLWILALVSLWRVALIVRAISVLQRWKWYSVVPVVMLFSDAVAMFLLWLTPFPLISFMGGLGLSPEERVLQQTSLLVGCLGVLTLPVWLIATIGFALKGSDSPPTDVSGENDIPRPAVSGSMWAFSIAALVIWALVLPATQAEQLRRRQVEQLVDDDRIVEAIELMSQYPQSAFPPNWDPPPKRAYGVDHPQLFDVVVIMAQTDAAPWVRQAYVNKVLRRARFDPFYESPFLLQSMSDERLAVWVDTLQRLPEGRQIVEFYRDDLLETDGERRRIPRGSDHESEQRKMLCDQLRDLLGLPGGDELAARQRRDSAATQPANSAPLR